MIILREFDKMTKPLRGYFGRAERHRLRDLREKSSKPYFSKTDYEGRNLEGVHRPILVISDIEKITQNSNFLSM